MPQIIYSMSGVRKMTPQGREILKGIWLSFFHGAKIGVLGLNGAGKSTLLRIMAGVDKDFAGETIVSDGVTIGYLPQEPELDPNSTVLEHVLSPFTPEELPVLAEMVARAADAVECLVHDGVVAAMNRFNGRA